MVEIKDDTRLHPKVTLQLYTSEKCFGRGVVLLLEKIKEYNSIRQAAIDIGMSYSKAWKIIRRAEKNFGFELLSKKTGGADGGGATLTEYGEKMLDAFVKCEQELAEFCDKKYKEYFSFIENK